MLVITTDDFEGTRNSDGDFFGKERLIEFLADHCTESATRMIELLKDEVQQFGEDTYSIGRSDNRRRQGALSRIESSVDCWLELRWP